MAIYIIPCTDGCDLAEIVPDTKLDGGQGDWGGIVGTEHFVGMTTKEYENSPVMHFDFTEVGGGETVTDAHLLFYITGMLYTEGEEPWNYTWGMYRCLRAWETDDTTWNEWDDSANEDWGAPGCHGGDGVDIEADNAIFPNGPNVTDLNTYWHVDMTAMVEDANGDDQILNLWINGEKTLVEEADTMRWQFASYRSALPPKLIICTDGSTMPTFSADVVDASSDDADENEDSGACDITNTLIRTRASTLANQRYWGGHRFHNGAFPANGSTILEAWFVIHVDANDDAYLDVYAEDAAGAGTFTVGAGDITDRTLTTASVEWSESGLLDGWWKKPASLNTILQELVDDYTLTTLALILKPKTDAVFGLDSDAYDFSASYTARLVLTWNEPAEPSAFVPQVIYI